MSVYYEDDLVTLHLGDCLQVTEWLDADVLVTDPPYGAQMVSFAGGGGRNPKHGRNSNGGRTPNAIQGDLTPAARDQALALWGNRPSVVFGSWRVERPPAVRSLLIWHKEGAYSGPLNAAFFNNHEEVYIIGDGAWRKSAPPLRSVITTTEHRGSSSRDTGHPTSKPIGLMELLIDRCPPGTIADPFAGSGSTLIAAKYEGRKAIGVEIDEAYCELIARRLSQDTLFGGVA